MTNSTRSDFKNASDEAVFFLFKTVYGPLGFTDDQIRARFIAKRAAYPEISPIPPHAPTATPTEPAISATDLSAAFVDFQAKQKAVGRSISLAQAGSEYLQFKKLLAYCNGNSELLNAAYSNFSAEQISAFVKDFL